MQRKASKTAKTIERRRQFLRKLAPFAESSERLQRVAHSGSPRLRRSPDLTHQDRIDTFATQRRNVPCILEDNRSNIAELITLLAQCALHQLNYVRVPSAVVMMATPPTRQAKRGHGEAKNQVVCNG